ncbi:MAG: dienelactone hydrolase family protein [Alphaproteobacteria bacterium]|nr:dienelactone hydrolase family protein [Alphaproteobacteria bacterium]
MGDFVTLTAADGHSLSAYKAQAAGTPKGGVVVLQEIFGINNHIQSVVDRFAADGYTAIAPALFDRVEKGVDLGYDEDTMKQGLGLRGQLNWEQVTADTNAAVQDIAGAGKTGVVGFCFGGSAAWVAAEDSPVQAAVGWYGGQIHQEIGRQPKCPVQLHFGTEDFSIPNEQIDEIKAAHADVPVYIYEGAGHGFNCDDRPSYHEGSAKLAYQRTLEFLGEHLG